MMETSSLPEEGETWNQSAREASVSPSRPRMRIEYLPGVGVFTWYGLVPVETYCREVWGEEGGRGVVKIR